MVVAVVIDLKINQGDWGYTQVASLCTRRCSITRNKKRKQKVLIARVEHRLAERPTCSIPAGNLRNILSGWMTTVVPSAEWVCLAPLNLANLPSASRKVELVACLAALETPKMPSGLPNIITDYIVGQRFLLVIYDEDCWVLDIETQDWLRIHVSGARRLRAATLHNGMIFGVVLADPVRKRWTVDVLNLATLGYQCAVTDVSGSVVVWDEQAGKFAEQTMESGWMSVVTEDSLTSLPLSLLNQRGFFYNWRKKEHRLFPILGTPRLNTQIVCLRDTYYVCGGFSAQNSVLAECEALPEMTSKSGVWQKIAPMIHARHWHRTLVVNQQFLLVVGGMDHYGNDHLPMEKYDPETNCWTLFGKSLPFWFPARSQTGLLL